MNLLLLETSNSKGTHRRLHLSGKEHEVPLDGRGSRGREVGTIHPVGVSVYLCTKKHQRASQSTFASTHGFTVGLRRTRTRARMQRSLRKLLAITKSTMTRNGICQKGNKDGSRVHDMRTKTDSHGNRYEACERCGTMFVSLPISDNRRKA